MDSPKVVIGLAGSTSSEDSFFAMRLGAELKDLGVDAEFLWCDMQDGANTSLDSYGALPVTRVAKSETSDLSEFWLDAIRFLEERAPCLYLADPYGHAGWIYPRLSDRVLVAPLLKHDDHAAYDHTRFLGKYCNALIAVDADLRLRMLADFPSLAKRVVTPGRDGLAGLVASLSGRLAKQVACGLFKRSHTQITVPRVFWAELGGANAIIEAKRLTSRIAVWPMPGAMAGPGAEKKRASRTDRLSDYRIAVGVTSGRISGVDIFSANLVRGLCARGYRAEIIQTLSSEKNSDALPLPADVPVTRINLPYAGWTKKWKALRRYLGAERTIYVPNFDEKHSAIAPVLSQDVRVVGIAHSDDPQHYNHILRLAPYWDAVVTVSAAITQQLAVLAPGLMSRASLIPYGVEVDSDLGISPRAKGSPLRVVYAGRIMRYQKRVFDLVEVAQAIRARNLDVEISVVGAGPDLEGFLAAAGPSLAGRTMRWVGALSNRELGQTLRESHAFILPSRFEGLPVSVLEAMANGCVPVVTDIRSGIPELIRDGENGFVIPVGDVECFVAALSRLEADEPMRVRMASGAHTTVLARYNIAMMIDRYVDAFERMLARDYVRPPGKIMVPPALRGVLRRIPDPPPQTRNLLWRAVGKFR